MLFNSPVFLVFLITALVGYYALRSSYRLQNLYLLVFSYIFYGWWDVRFLYLIVCSTAIDFSIARLLTHRRMKKSQVLAVCSYALIACFAFVVVPWGVWIAGFKERGTDFSFLESLGAVDTWRVFFLTFACLVFGVVVNNFVVSRAQEDTRRKVLLGTSVFLNLMILGVFKYFNFFAENFELFVESLLGISPSSWTLNIVLPVGISFYTFQTMSYAIDVYRRKMASSDSLIDFAAYVSFFPQLVAGPIERAEHLLPQFQRSRPSLTYASICDGAWLCLWGLFKKMVVADQMAIVVNHYFEPFDSQQSSLLSINGWLAWVVVVAFAFQIYGDFSGYTDIARGVAKFFGFELMVNFYLPFFALTPSDFWRRWHISLSSWLRDYLYISLGGNRFGRLVTYRNLFLTMLLGGIWHGASWNFVIWGAFHGALLCAYRMTAIDQYIHRPGGYVSKVTLWLAMTVFTLLGWLIFRSQNMETIRIFASSMFLRLESSSLAWEEFGKVIFFIWLLLVIQSLQWIYDDLDIMKRLHWFVRLNFVIVVAMSILAFSSSEPTEFIYFAF